MRILAGLAILVAVTLTLPFLFTTAIVRHFISSSEYAPFQITIRKASLNLGGVLTIYDLSIHDVNDHSGKPLIEVNTARVDFNWSQVSSRHLRALDVEGLRVYARSGRDSQFTILRLLNPGDYSGTKLPLPPPSTAPPLRVDQIVLTGDIFVESYDPWLQLFPPGINRGIPLQLHIRTTGPSDRAITEIAVALGERNNAAAELPSIAGQLRVEKTSGDNTDVTISNFLLSNVTAAASSNFIAALWPGFAQLPADLQRGVSVHLDSFYLSGKVTAGTDPRFVGEISARGIQGKFEGPGLPMAIEDLSGTAQLDVPLNANALDELIIRKGNIAAALIQCGPWRLTKLNADGEVEEGVANLAQMTATSLDGSIVVSCAWPLRSTFPQRGVLTLRDLDGFKLRSRLPDDLKKRLPYQIQGLLSAKLTLNEHTEDTLAGRLEINTGDVVGIQDPTGFVDPIVLNRVGISSQWEWSPRVLSGIDSLPVLSKGRIWAESISSATLNLNNLKGDFSLDAEGFLKVDDLTASMAEDTSFHATAGLNIASRRLDNVAVYLNNFSPELLKKWLPEHVRTDTHVSASLSIVQAPLEEGSLIKSYSALLKITLPESSSLTWNDAKFTLAGNPTIDAMIRLPSDLSAIRGFSITASGFTNLTLTDDALKNIFGKSESLTQNGIHAGIEKLTLEAEFMDKGARIVGSFAIDKLSAGMKLQSETSIELTQFTAQVPFQVAWDAHRNLEQFVNRIIINRGVFGIEKVAYGTNVVSNLAAQFSLDKGVVTLDPVSKMAFAGGTIQPSGSYRVMQNRLNSSKIIVSKLQQDVLVKNLLTEKFGAQGTVSGEITLIRNSRDQLVGNIELDTDGEGRLRFSEEVASILAPVAKQAIGNSAPMPSNFDQIISAQLKDYPYTVGRIGAGDSSGDLEVQLNYTRVPLSPGEPGYAVPVQIEGKPVLINYPLQLKGLKLVIARTSVMDVIGLGTGLGEFLPGLQKQSASSGPIQPAATLPASTRPATQPATTRPAATQPATTRPES